MNDYIDNDKYNVRVGETSFILGVREYKDGIKCPYISVMPVHNTPFEQKLVIYNWANLKELGDSIINLNQLLDDKDDPKEHI